MLGYLPRRRDSRVRRTYYRSSHRDVPARATGWTPWVRHTDHRAGVEVRILSDRTADGGTATRLVDGHGGLLHDVIVGRPGREAAVALITAETITELLRHNEK